MSFYVDSCKYCVIVHSKFALSSFSLVRTLKETEPSGHSQSISFVCSRQKLYLINRPHFGPFRSRLSGCDC